MGFISIDNPFLSPRKTNLPFYLTNDYVDYEYKLVELNNNSSEYKILFYDRGGVLVNSNELIENKYKNGNLYKLNNIIVDIKVHKSENIDLLNGEW